MLYARYMVETCSTGAFMASLILVSSISPLEDRSVNQTEMSELDPGPTTPLTT